MAVVVKPFNYNTLEPKMLKVNSLAIFNSILDTNIQTDNELLKHLNHNKSEWALKFFETDKNFTFPDYMLNAI